MPHSPDIVLIMSDEHAPQFSSVYGHPIVRTPNMARLAAEGVVFDAAYCASPICVPSRMAFLTGRYPTRTEAWDNGSPLRSDIPTIAHVMRCRGYETVLIGKMHFIGADQLHGFERRLVDDSRVCGTWIETTDWDDPARPRPNARLRAVNAGAGRTAHVQNDEDVLSACLAYLDDLGERGPARRPVFLCVSFNAPHFPLRAPDHFDDYWPDNVDAPDVTREELDRQHPFHKRLRSYFDIDGLAPEETLRARAALYALTTWLDDMVGTIVERVDRSMPDQPLLAYISDHGDMAGEHGLWWKCCFFEESVRVPMILRWPDRIAPGRRISSPVSLIDLAVTLAEIAGAGDDPRAAPFMDNADGRSLLPLIAGTDTGEREVISEYCAHAAGRPIRMIRRANWKYVYYHGEADELFDLSADPREKTNLAGRRQYRTIAADLRQRLLAGWDPEEVERRVRAHQADRGLIARTESRGTFE